MLYLENNGVSGEAQDHTLCCILQRTGCRARFEITFCVVLYNGWGAGRGLGSHFVFCFIMNGVSGEV